MRIADAKCYCTAIVMLLYCYGIAIVLENKSNWIETEAKTKSEQIDSEPNQIEFTSKPKSKQNLIQQVLIHPYFKSNETQIQIKSKQKQIGTEAHWLRIKMRSKIFSLIKSKIQANLLPRFMSTQM